MANPLYAMVIVVCSANADGALGTCELSLAPRPMVLTECEDQKIQDGVLAMAVRMDLARPDQKLGVRCDLLVNERLT